MNVHLPSAVFLQTAPLFWSAGLPAIPLIPGQKRPAITSWQTYADRQPSGDEQAAWLNGFAGANIGLPMGPASGLVAIDVDCEDPAVLAILDRLLPPSPYRRVGSKGFVTVYKYSGERTVRIQTPSGMICEILSRGCQIALPPSIHPDTGRAYTANAKLYEVLDQIPALPTDIEDQIRAELMKAGYDVGKAGSSLKTVDFVPAGQRDNKMVAMSGLLARAVLRGERSLGEALIEITTWVEEKVEQVIGDPVTVEKARKKLIEFIHRDVHGARKLALPSGWDDGLAPEDIEQLGLEIGDDDEKWTAARLIQQLAYDFQENPDLQSEALHSCIQENMVRLARSEGEINELDEGRILKFIATQSGGTVALGDLRKRLRTLRIGDIEGENHDEVAGAVHEHINQFGELRYHASRFWQWTGSHWGGKPEFEIIQTISGEFGFYPSCRKTSDYHGILKLMTSKCAKGLRQQDLNGVNFANGFLDEGLVLRDHHPDYGCTYVLPYPYNPDSTGRMPIFNQFMVDSWGHDPDFSDKVAVFQELIGATLFSVAPQYQRAFCLFGAAGAGKSVAMAIVQGLLPEGSVSSVPPQDWGDKFLPAQMYGKIMNAAGELSESRKITGDTFKQIVGGDVITGQHKNQQPFVFRPTCSQWFASNHLPRTGDRSDGFNRRWLFLEWTRPVPAAARTIDLASVILADERHAIAAWAVEGFARLKLHGRYTASASGDRLVERMARENNSVRSFLAEDANVVVGAAVLSQGGLKDTTMYDLYEAYRSYCFTSQQPRMDATSFRNALAALGSEFGFEIEPQEAKGAGSVRGVALIA